MRRHRPDRKHAGFGCDAHQVAERGQVHEIRRRGQTVLHHRDQAHAAGEGTRVFSFGEQPPGLANRARAVVAVWVHQPSAIAPAPARIAATMF